MDGTRRWQNFEAIRLAAAVAVVFSHCFMLTFVGDRAEPFVRIFGEHRDIGRVAVGVFFVMSGFLITKSYLERASTVAYLVSRVMRIFPALVVCTLLTAFVIGPIYTTKSLADYVTSAETWSYIWHTALLQPYGGFAFPAPLYDGPMGGMMLATTWSLSPEFACYLGVLIFGAIGMVRLPVALALVAVGVWSHSHWTALMLSNTAWALMFFAAGAALLFVHERRRPSRPAVAAAGVGLVVGAAAGYPMQSVALFGSVLVIQLATSERVSLGNAARFGDLSYGVYLYGWPMQQLVRTTWGPTITWWQLFVLSMPLALTCAWLSWHLVESRALAFASRYARQARAASQPVAGAHRPAAAAAAPGLSST